MAVLQERNNEQTSKRPTPVKQIPAALQLANRKKREQQQQQQQRASGQGLPPRHPRLSLANDQRQVSQQVIVSSDRYEEWMKIASDGKITATNTWNLALIDYFHDMSLLRSDDNSINFQKASCTLDGCVKIWTSRVDSVANETGKLLSGLAQDPRRAQDGDDDDDENEDGQGEDGEDADGDGSGGKKQKRTRKAQTTTLADSFAKLKAKSLDLEFTVDPLFKKTSADFDEGGAGGILMNHLGCDGQMRVVFDAGDAKLTQSDDGDDDEISPEDAAAEEEEKEHTRIDLSKLKLKFLPSLDELENKCLCPTLASFKFGNAQTIDIGAIDLSDDMPAFSDPAPVSQRRQNSSVHDDFVDYNDYGGGGDDGEPVDAFAADIGPAEEVDFFAADDGPDASESDRRFVFDDENSPGPAEEVVMSMEDLKHDLFDQFDLKQRGRNWAGPEHWKMRRNLVKSASAAAKDEEGATTSKASRKEKTVFKLDFDAPPPIPLDELFAPMPKAKATRKGATPVTRKSTRASSVAASESVRDHKQDFTLPRDYHFNASKLLRLFLKPDMPLKIRRRVREGGSGPSAEVYVAAATGGRNAAPATEEELMEALFDVGAQGEDLGGMDDYADDEPAHFATQFLAADDDDEDDEAQYFGEGAARDAVVGPSASGANGDEDDDGGVEAAASQAVRRVRPENVSYAKKAKRVDVKKLKENIWTTLERNAIVVPDLPAETIYRPAESSDADDAEAADVKQVAKKEAMVPVIESLRSTYPKEKMDEISTSFCFICLLHLANEKGLRIQVPGRGDEQEEKDSVARFEQLRVLKAVNSPVVPANA